MKHAHIDGKTWTAKPSAPRHATCPECGWPVRLRRAPSGTWAYYHLPGGPACARRPRPQSLARADRERWPVEFPEYAVALGMVRTTILDALDGYGMDTLTDLFAPFAQSGLQELLDASPSVTWERTQRMCRRLLSLDDDTRQAVRHALTWGSLAQLEEALDANG